MEHLNQHLLKYELKQVIGQGGMATVYLAVNKTNQAVVAVKILNKEFVGNDNIKKRFMAEAWNIFNMSHPNVIRVMDFVEVGDMVAFVMEYIEGDTLKSYLENKGKLETQEIKTLFTQMLEAVGYVHQQGFVHRDIKPSNFMMTAEKQIKLLDFGIAKNTDEDSLEYTQTGTNHLMGTPLYMSPEQIKSTKTVTLQSDIYSLGVVLWQMVMGRKPYNTATISTFELQTKIVNELLPKTDTLWDKVIEKATHKSLDSRYKNIENFLADFNKTQNSDATQSQSKIVKINDNETIVTQQDEKDQTVFSSNAKENKTKEFLFKNKKNLFIVGGILTVLFILQTFYNSRLEASAISEIEKNMIFLEGGRFLMGCNYDDKDCQNDEKPMHYVGIDSFRIGKYEVTQSQWRGVMGGNPSKNHGCNNCPVEMVSWDDVQLFLEKLNDQTGKNYRLPTEAEWEFAARNGEIDNSYLYSKRHKITEVAWYGKNSDKKTHPVGEKEPNELGLYDMIGNVREWCSDWYSEDYYKNSENNYGYREDTNPQGPESSDSNLKVLRGGTWSSDFKECRISNRGYLKPSNFNEFNGFRLVLD